MAARAHQGRMPPPRRGKPYYDVDRGQTMILPPGGGKAIPYVGGDGPPKFDAGKALRRSGVQARSLGSELADDAGSAAAAIAERQPFNVGAFGGFLVTALAALFGLIVLDLLLRRPAAFELALGGFGRGIKALADPTDPLFKARTMKPATNPDGTVQTPVPGAIPGGGGRLTPDLRGVGGLFFPVGGKASFSNDYNAPRSPDSTGGTGVHGAIDIFAKRGTPVVALEGGTLNRVGFNTFGGNRLWVKGSQFEAYYAHLDEYAPGIREGARVEAGQVLGYVGDTGSAKGTPPHLHLQLERGGFPLNPFDLLRQLLTSNKSTSLEGVTA